MGYAVLHMEKASASDSGMSAHIERTIAPKNADASRTHLNREVITFPEGVTNRTEAIQRRLETVGLQRKIGKNQVRAIRILLTGSPDDMKRIEQAGRLDDWCRDNLDWLAKTYGIENIVSAVLHLDETTPHIHATMTPIVTGERRKAKAEQTTSKKKYRKKSTDTARLCADDVMSRIRLKEYQNTYAEQMAKYGLKRGIEGSEAKHIATSQYYQDLLAQTESVQEGVTALLEEQKEAQTLLANVKSEVSRERFKNTAADVGTTILNGVESLLGSSKTKQQQQEIEALEAKNHNLANDIKNLKSKIATMEAEHKTAINKLSEQLNKIYSLFPHIKDLLRWENLLRTIGIPKDMVRQLFNRETVEGCTGRLYSKEHLKSFNVENASLKLEQNKDTPSKIRFSINGIGIFDWFAQKQNEFLKILSINSPEQGRDRGLKR